MNAEDCFRVGHHSAIFNSSLLREDIDIDILLRNLPLPLRAYPFGYLSL